MKTRFTILPLLILLIGSSPVMAAVLPNATPSTRIVITPLTDPESWSLSQASPFVTSDRVPSPSSDLPDRTSASPDPFFPELSDDLSLDDFADDDLLLEPEASFAPSPLAPMLLSPQRNGGSGLPLVIEFPDLFLPAKSEQIKTPTADLAITLQPVARPGSGFEAVISHQGGDLLSAVSIEINGAQMVAELPADCQWSDRLIVCRLEQLASGQQVTLAFDTRLTHIPEQQPLINAVAFFEGVDPDVTNNTASYPPTDTLSGSDLAPKSEQNKYAISDFFVLPKALAGESLPPPDRALVAQGLVMPVLAGEEQIEKDLIPTIAVDPKVVTPGEAIILIMTISNRSQTQYKKVHATVFFPFDYLDLINATEPYTYDQAEESIDFVKDTLNPGEQWLIRVNGKVKEAEQVINAEEPRAIVTSFMIEAEDPPLSDNFASTQTLVVKDKNPQVTLPTPAIAASPTASAPADPANAGSGGSQPKPFYSPKIQLADTGPRQVLLITLIAVVISGGLLSIRQHRRRSLAAKSGAL